MTESHLASRLNALFALWEGQAPVAIVKDLLSFSPTRHVFNTTSGSRFFACCAVDTLLIAHLLDEDVDIETTPPGNAEPLCINIHNKELRVSSSAVIAIPLQHDDGSGTNRRIGSGERRLGESKPAPKGIDGKSPNDG